jgi:hypothetical protein
MATLTLGNHLDSQFFNILGTVIQQRRMFNANDTDIQYLRFHTLDRRDGRYRNILSPRRFVLFALFRSA